MMSYVVPLLVERVSTSREFFPVTAGASDQDAGCCENLRSQVAHVLFHEMLHMR
jgi:hypothetical protein